jgi:hypothetical protein
MSSFLYFILSLVWFFAFLPVFWCEHTSHLRQDFLGIVVPNRLNHNGGQENLHQFHINISLLMSLHCEKRLTIFLSPGGMSLTKLLNNKLNKEIIPGQGVFG